MWGLDVLTTKVHPCHSLLHPNQRSLSQPYLSFSCQLNLQHMFKFQLFKPPRTHSLLDCLCTHARLSSIIPWKDFHGFDPTRPACPVPVLVNCFLQFEHVCMPDPCLLPFAWVLPWNYFLAYLDAVFLGELKLFPYKIRTLSKCSVIAAVLKVMKVCLYLLADWWFF